MHVLGFEAGGIQQADGLGKYGLADAVSGHRYYGVLGHC
jgi:hypothetical protein